MPESQDRSNDSRTSDPFSLPVDEARIPAAKNFFAVF
jgi:hypothetical protein